MNTTVVSSGLNRTYLGGVAALHHQLVPGPTPKLTDDRPGQVPNQLAQCSASSRFAGAAGTAKPGQGSV
jgi:hypothetical protein